LNAPLDAPLRFELRPFSAELETAWLQAVGLILTYERMNIVLPQAAARVSPNSCCLSSLRSIRSNYSDDLRGLSAPPCAHGAGGRALDAHRSGHLGHAVAARVGVSLRGLGSGVSRVAANDTDPVLRRIRLTRQEQSCWRRPNPLR